MPGTDARPILFYRLQLRSQPFRARQAHVAYANFARVTATPEEVIIDFALNPNPFQTGRQEIAVSQRLIMNFFTAKRLLMALSHTIQRHEQTYGSVELNLLRRAQP